ncbi:MAG: glycoside hydrolase family 43 protein [Bacteroidia bacterium]|nr:glycoside hydrolase family 43 protein [Bacteroidia bacterium]
MTNPILRGFHPDPSVVRVGDDFYLATSTFEWFPGVMIYHSKDLLSWKLVARPLDKPSLLDMKGVPDSCGVWAPCLSHDGEQFHLVYSRVRSFDGVWKDTPNFLTSATNIQGPWSEAVFLGSQGFDGSMFHDEDGKKWYLSMEVDHRKGKFFGDIVLQEYDPMGKRLIGTIHRIFSGSELGLTEGPHLYKKDGLYYLILAEGGTEYGHAVTLARSTSMFGPYELSPRHPFLSNAQNPLHPLQKTGHADLVKLEDDKWAIFFLTGRPLSPHGRCPLGRETAMEILEWKENDWPHPVSEQSFPRLDIPEYQMEGEAVIEEINFSINQLPPSYQSLRVPITEDWAFHDQVEGTFTLKGRESLSSTFEQSLLARRVQSLDFTYEVQLRFRPENFQQMAGLVCYYNTSHYFYLHVYGDEDGESRFIQLIRCDNYSMEELTEPIPIELEVDKINLKVKWEKAMASFSYANEQKEYHPIKGVFDASILSDDYVRDGSIRYRPAFTGAFVGIACQDLSGQGKTANFFSLKYEEY